MDPTKPRDQHSSSTSIMTVVSTKDTRVALRRDALNALADGCGHGGLAENYELTVHAARHYWNLCMPYVQESEERATLAENLTEILQSLQSVYKFRPVEEVPVVSGMAANGVESGDGGSGEGEDGKKSEDKRESKNFYSVS